MIPAPVKRAADAAEVAAAAIVTDTEIEAVAPASGGINPTLRRVAGSEPVNWAWAAAKENALHCQKFRGLAASFPSSHRRRG